MSLKFTRHELVLISVARQIQDYDTLLLGIGLPLVAGVVAKRTHAPNCVLMLESGVVGFDPLVPMVTIAETTCFSGYAWQTDLFSMFNAVAHKGFIDKAVLGVGQIDRFGNINSSFLGKDPRKSPRISGAGGAPEFMAYAKKTILTLRGGQFVEQLPYLTSPGYLKGGGERHACGRYTPNSGPCCLITPQGIFRFMQETQEMYLDSVFPGFTPQDVQEKVPWDLKVSENLKAFVPPTEEELTALRTFSPQSSFSTRVWAQLLAEARGLN